MISGWLELSQCSIVISDQGEELSFGEFVGRVLIDCIVFLIVKLDMSYQITFVPDSYSTPRPGTDKR